MERTELIRDAMEKDGVKFLRVSPETLTTVEEEYGVTFPDVLREFYLDGVPTGTRFPEWLSTSEHDGKEVRRMLHFPVKSMLAAVENGDFWSRSWGEKPESFDEQMSVAKGRLAAAMQATPLIPLAGHCYLVCSGAEAGPVISVFGDDVTVMGEDLYDFLEKRYRIKERTPVSREAVEACGAWKAFIS